MSYFNELDRIIHSAITADDIELLAESIGFDSDMLYQRIDSLMPDLKPMTAYAVSYPQYPIANHSAEWKFRNWLPAQAIPLYRAEIAQKDFDGPSSQMVRYASLKKQLLSESKLAGGTNEKPETVSEYRTITRKYLREVQNTYAGEPLKRTAYVNIIIGDIEDAEPSDFNSDIYPLFADEKREQKNHVRAESKYARRRLRHVTQETFSARSSEQVAQWLNEANDEKKEEILALLESPLNPVDLNYISNIPETIWQKQDESIETIDRRGDVPTIRLSDWGKFRETMQYTLVLHDRHHWTHVGSAKHGDATWTVKANRFAEYRREYRLARLVIQPGQAKYLESTLGIDHEDVLYLCRTLGMGVHDMTVSTKQGRKRERTSPSERVARARERARERARDKRKATANQYPRNARAGLAPLALFWQMNIRIC